MKTLFTCALVTAAVLLAPPSAWPADDVIDTVPLEPAESAQGWIMSTDASTYYKGVGASAAQTVTDRKEGEAAVRLELAFVDAGESETIFVSKRLPTPVDASEYDAVSLWYKITTDKIGRHRGLVLRLRDRTPKAYFVDLCLATRDTVVAGKWCHAMMPFPTRTRFDRSAIGTITFRLEDIDYYNTDFELTFDDIRLVKLRKPVEKPYEPKVLPRSPDTSLDVLYLRPGGACNYRLEPAIRSLPESHSLKMCRVMKNYTNPWYLDRDDGRTHWLSYFPQSHEELLGFDIVILAGIPSEALTRQEQRMLVDFVASGGGLLVVGGPLCFGPGRYGESELARVLPVEVATGGENDFEAVNARLESVTAHPVTAGIPVKGMLRASFVHRVTRRPEAEVLLRARAKKGEGPAVLIAGSFGKGRTLVLPVFHKAYYKLNDLFHARCYDDLIRQALRWLAGRQPAAQVVSCSRFPRNVVIGQPVRVSLQASAPAGWRAKLVVTRGGVTVREQICTPDTEGKTDCDYLAPAGKVAKGVYEFSFAVVDAEGKALATRDAPVEIVPPLEVTAFVPCGRDVTASGFTFEPAMRCANRSESAASVRISARIDDPSGSTLHRFPDVRSALKARSGAATHTYQYRVPNLRNGEYAFAVSMADAESGESLDECRLPFHVVRELDMTDTLVIASFPGVAITSEVNIATEEFAKKEIDDLLAHGYNAIQMSGRMGAMGPRLNNADRVGGAADSYAQRLGMAIHGGCTRLTFRFRRDRPPEPCVHSPEYRPALEKLLASSAAWTHKVPRLHAVTICDEPAVNPKMLCRCEHCRTEFRKRYGAELPKDLGGLKDPRLIQNTARFYTDYFAKVWQESADFMHRRNPEFRIRNNYTPSAFGTVRISVAMGDLLSWCEPIDVLSTTGGYPYIKSFPNRERLERVFRNRRCTLAFLRGAAMEQGKPFGAWTETCVPLGDPVRAARRNLYMTIGAGAKFVTAWYNGLAGPHASAHPELWDDLGKAHREVASIGPLLLRLNRKASVALLFPHSDWILGRKYSGPYGRTMEYYDLLSKALGNVDILWERQIAKGRLDGYEVLFLPSVTHLRRDAAEAILTFLAKGGIVIADRLPMLDEVAEELDTLAAALGVTVDDSRPRSPTEVRLSTAGEHFLGIAPRSYRTAAGTAVLAKFADNGGPAIIQGSHGLGKTLFFAFDTERTHAEMQAEGAQLRSLIRRFVERSSVGIQAWSDNPWVECNYFEAPQCAFLILVNGSEQRQPCSVTMRSLPGRPNFVCDMISGSALPCRFGEEASTVSLEVDALSARVIGLYQERPSSATLSLPTRTATRGGSVSYRVKLLSSDRRAARGSYVLRVRVIDSAGTERPEYGRLTCTTNGEYDGRFTTAINDPEGQWQIEATEKLTKATAAARFALVTAAEGG